MFDISWSEFLLIGVVALIVIGPKEMPAVMRTLGHWTRKVRSMAAEFQSQFQEAMREAEMADLKKEVDNLADEVRNFDPLKGVREDIENTGEVVKRSLASTPAETPALPAVATETPPALPPAATEPAPTETPAETPPAPFEAAAVASAETPAPAPAPSEPPPAREMEAIGAEAPPAAAQSTEKSAHEDGTGRTG
jgi:sec-independent protein translocase protein TatB